MSADTIPDDVLRLAKDEIAKGEMAIVTVVRAIMAERERCAQIAEAEYEKRFENADGYPASRVHDYVIVARAIERAIRQPTGE